MATIIELILSYIEKSIGYDEFNKLSKYKQNKIIENCIKSLNFLKEKGFII